MPETPALSALDERVAGVVHAVLEQRTGDLAALVAAAIDRELQRLVETELAGRTDGATVARDDPASLGGATRHCVGCDLDLPVTAFSPGHNRCRECRKRERRAAKLADDRPRPA